MSEVKHSVKETRQKVEMSDTTNGGSLKIQIIEANLIRNTETTSQMDPYVNVKTANKVIMRTKTKDEAGKTPVWNETQELQITDPSEFLEFVEFEILDEDNTGSDLIGSHSFHLSELCTKEPL